MSTPAERSVWPGGRAYEPYVGRWSRLVAREFLDWLALPPGRRWLDVGCGTGALSQIVLERAAPAEVAGVDPSEGYVGDAQALPGPDASFDAVVSGLVLNFVPDPTRAAAEMRRVARPGGLVGAYVWDYAGEMQLMRRFWDAAGALEPAARERDEGRRFPVCRPGPLADLFRAARLRDVETRAVDVPTVFRDFDDYWSPFLGGQAPAPGYCMSLPDERRAALRERIRGALPIRGDGSIHLIARAWAVRGLR